MQDTQYKSFRLKIRFGKPSDIEKTTSEHDYITPMPAPQWFSVVMKCGSQYGQYQLLHPLHKC